MYLHLVYLERPRYHLVSNLVCLDLARHAILGYQVLAFFHPWLDLLDHLDIVALVHLELDFLLDQLVLPYPLACKQLFRPDLFVQLAFQEQLTCQHSTLELLERLL